MCPTNAHLASVLRVTGVPSEVLDPRNTWADKDAYDRTAKDLAARFRTNDAKYTVSDDVRAAGPNH